MRPRNFGIRKICSCGRSNWSRCPHSWYFSYKPTGGPRHRFSLDEEFQRHIDNRGDAEKLATDLRAAINAGTFRRADQRPVPAVGGITLALFAQTYLERVSKPGKVSWVNDAGMLARLVAHKAIDGRRLGDWPLTAITEDAIEAFYNSLELLAASTRNSMCRSSRRRFAGPRRRATSRSPISDDSSLKRTTIAQRRRRVSPDEEKALIEAARESVLGGLRLQWLIIAAIETGCRVGELLALQWADVDLTKHTLLVRAVERGAKKTGRSRRLPMSARLQAVLAMATDPAGRTHPVSDYIFGQFGQRVRDIKKAWETCVVRAHSHAPVWTTGNKLSAESREALHAIDLHFHDLRHEAGCRWLEAGWPIHHVQEMLGHANLSQTSTYLHATELGLHESMARFDTSRGQSVAKRASIDRPTHGHAPATEARKDQLH